jgi:hypothetical protein
MPESFIFLHANNRFDEARKSLNYVAWFNGKPAINDKFDTEMTEVKAPLNATSNDSMVSQEGGEA